MWMCVCMCLCVHAFILFFFFTRNENSFSKTNRDKDLSKLSSFSYAARDLNKRSQFRFQGNLDTCAKDQVLGRLKNRVNWTD